MKWNWPFVRKVLLGVLVLSSLYLSGIIWRSPGNYTDSINGKEKASSTAVTFDRKIERVFGPEQVILHEADKSELTDKKQATALLGKTLNGLKLSNLSGPFSLERGEYHSQLKENHVVMELVFSGKVPFGLYKKQYAFLSKDSENRTFNRVYFSTQNMEELYFYNTDAKLFYRADVSQIDTKEIKQLIEAVKETAYQVKSYETSDNLTYLPMEDIEIPYFSYMVEQQPNSLYIGRLFEYTSEVQTIRHDNEVRYFDYFSELSINEKTNILNYSRSEMSGDAMDLTRHLKDSFNELLLYDNWPNDIHFANYSSTTNQVSFKRYLQGLPVFGKVDHGTTYISVNDSTLASLQVPLVVAQTPISNEEEDKVLLSGDELMSRLEMVGYSLKEIEGIKLGYTWMDSSESSRVVSFVPEWYIKVNGTWEQAITIVGDKGGNIDGL
ncbi:MAG: YycH family regulatory protein [Pisciglobus halotolerans]|nr:YycH family regulatory protein [Pisciglobus halotolerans]